jgi:hypothetical protein
MAKRELREKVNCAQNTKHTMVAAEPLVAFSNISASTRPISTKFDEEIANEVENHLPYFHDDWLEFIDLRGPYVGGNRV